MIAASQPRKPNLPLNRLFSGIRLILPEGLLWCNSRTAEIRLLW